MLFLDHPQAAITVSNLWYIIEDGIDHTFDSSLLGVPGIELPAEGFLELGLVTRIRRPYLSNRGVLAAGSEDQARLIPEPGRCGGG